MTEFATDDVELEYNELNNQADRINVLTTKLANLMSQIQNEKDQHSKWMSHFSGLSTNNWVGENRCKEFQRQEAECRNRIPKTMELVEIQEQKLRELQMQRMQKSSEICNNFQTKKVSYANKLQNAPVKYCDKSLLKDIEELRKEFDKENRKLEMLKQYLEDAKARSGLHCLNVKENVKDVATINDILKDLTLSSSRLLNKIRPEKDALQQIQSDIKQKKMVLERFQTEEKQPVFVKPRATFKQFLVNSSKTTQ